MILTDYYLFEKKAVHAKTRLDCTASTGGYEEMEEKRATKATKETACRDATNVGDLICYICDVPESFGRDGRRKADKSISIKSKNLSSVFVPDVSLCCGYGDFKGTSDGLLFVFHNWVFTDKEIQKGALLEIFVARGQAHNIRQLYTLMADGELDEEMETLRNKAGVSEEITGRGLGYIQDAED